MIIRLLSIVFGVTLLAVVVWLGFEARNDQTFVIWFGLAAAILAPTGIASFAYALRAGDREVLRQLARVPEIEKLIEAAKSQEEKVRLLQQEREQLLVTVQLEARREALLHQKDGLENEAVRVLADLQVVEAELATVSEEIQASPAVEAIVRLREKMQAIRRGDVVFRIGKRYFTLDRDLVLSLPLGRVLWWYLGWVNHILARRRRS